MRRLALALVLFAPALARAQAADELADDQAASLDDRVTALEDRVAALEGVPSDLEQASGQRASDLGEAIRQLDAVAQALSLGQTDVASALNEVLSALDVEDRGRMEQVHAQAAAGAIGAALDAVGRGDLFNARGAIDVAQVELARARDAALAR